jgi:hypothetical protein
MTAEPPSDLPVSEQAGRTDAGAVIAQLPLKNEADVPSVSNIHGIRPIPFRTFKNTDGNLSGKE